ncbi:MAG: hypothetical protein KDI82_02740 [Gammaproteobacteria bacterium]|nr:hypothetical protein [Gammaproteobacteria bacterium]
MSDLVGKTISIAGMQIEIIGDSNERWECRNLTTDEILLMDKAVVERAIKLGKAEFIDADD